MMKILYRFDIKCHELPNNECNSRRSDIINIWKFCDKNLTNKPEFVITRRSKKAISLGILKLSQDKIWIRPN
ncbi:unnamed protein product [Blepharisma stoltei]|uniref:Uncharacterized protein n=1 Tax=Blepharisma stoltei TaxID=1481888 RepID=A0AAU9IJY5_9CILI|nr:unnamed protein product [Blepharisma stoltei]